MRLLAYRVIIRDRFTRMLTMLCRGWYRMLLMFSGCVTLLMGLIWRRVLAARNRCLFMFSRLFLCVLRRWICIFRLRMRLFCRLTCGLYVVRSVFRFVRRLIVWLLLLYIGLILFTMSIELLRLIMVGLRSLVFMMSLPLSMVFIVARGVCGLLSRRV